MKVEEKEEKKERNLDEFPNEVNVTILLNKMH